MLVRDGVITMSHLDEALMHQQKSQTRLASILYLLQMADADVLARALAQQFWQHVAALP